MEITNSLAVELDPNKDGVSFDPNDNHISVHTNGDDSEAASMGWATMPFDISDGASHSLTISYVPGLMTVWSDLSQEPILELERDLSELVDLSDGMAWVGLTASKGEGTPVDNHDILSWSFTPTLPAPSASFTTNDASGPAPHAVTFTNTTLGAFTSVEWDFGDGATSAEVSPAHIYTIAGDYNVTLIMTGPGGTDTVVMENLITVEPGPITTITIEPFDIDVTVGESVQLTAIASDEYGNEVTDAEVTWSVSSDAGAIAPSGLFTGGETIGIYLDALTIDFLREGVVSRANHDITINDGLIYLWSGDGNANDSVAPTTARHSTARHSLPASSETRLASMATTIT